MSSFTLKVPNKQDLEALKRYRTVSRDVSRRGDRDSQKSVIDAKNYTGYGRHLYFVSSSADKFVKN